MEAQLHKGWLAEQLDEAASDYAMAFSPSWISAAGGNMAKSPVQPGLDEKDAARLREKLAFRYREWTGRDLAADLAPALPRHPMNAEGE